MGASIGGEEKKSDVEINVVPFIDLMSCLTAFLLVTAVWSTQAQIDIEPSGQSDAKGPPNTLEAIPSLLLTDEGVFVGIPSGERSLVAKRDGAYDWRALGELLGEYRLADGIDLSKRVEVAAEDSITYQHVIDAMDTTIAAGFIGVSYVDPASLSVPFRL